MKKIAQKLMIMFLLSGISAMMSIAQNPVTGIAGNGSKSAPVIIPNPSPLYFDDTYIASSSQSTLYIFNAGDANLVISQGNFSGPFETYNSFPITITPGNVHEMVIHFKPFQLGLIQGSVTFISNDPVTPSISVPLIGTCINTPINGWEWIYTGYNYILTDIEFPEGQDQIGFTVGMSVTYNGLGIVLKTTNGGDTWTQMTQNGINGIESCSFPTLQTGYAVGWNNNILKTTNGGQTWQSIPVTTNVYYYASVEFKDANNGIILAVMGSGSNKVFRTTNGGQSWTEGTGNNGWSDVTWAGGSTWYATGTQYVSKSTNDGATWTNVYSQGMELVGLDFKTPEYGIACGDYGQVITTRNGGQTWETDLIYDWLLRKPFVWDNDTAWVCGTPEYIYKTTDGCQNWVSDFNGNNMKAFYKILFTNNYTGFVCGGSNGIVLRKKPATVLVPVITATPNPLLFNNTNVGQTSQKTLTINNTGNANLVVANIQSTNPVFTANPSSFTVSPGGSQIVTVTFAPTATGLAQGNLQIINNSSVNPYLVAVSGTGTQAGPTPVIIANPDPLYFDDTYIASSSQKTLHIFNAGTANLVITQGNFSGPFETYNSFPITVTPGNVHDMVIHFKPFNLGLIQGSVTFVSNDPVTPNATVSLIGNSINTPINGWEWIYTGYNYILTDIEFPEGQDQVGYTGGQSVTYNGLGVVLKTTDGGDSWTSLTSYGIAGIERISFPTLQVGYAAGWANNIMKTTNGGLTWQSLPVTTDVYYYSSIEFKDASNGIILAKMNAGDPKLFRTTNGGQTWTEGTGNEAWEDITWAGGSTWYTTGYSNVCKSTNDGATWTTVYAQGGLLLGADFLTPEYGVACGDYGQVITTRDGGATWEVDQIYDWLLHKPFVWDNDTAWVTGTPEYIYKTTDGGQNWVSDFDGNWMKAFYKIMFTDNYTGFVCGGSNGIVVRKKPANPGYLEPPTNLQAVVSIDDVTLNWDAPAQRNLLGYNIYRDNSKINAATVTGTTYTDYNLQPGTYVYAVSAVYSNGISGKSEPVQVSIEGLTGKIHGFVRNAITHAPVTSAVITASNADNGALSTTTIFGSYYSMLLPPGTYNLTCTADGYQTATATNIQVIANKNRNVTFYLTPTAVDYKTGTAVLPDDQAEVKIYPNPAREMLNVDGKEISEIMIINQSGQVVYENKNPGNLNTINVNDLNGGIYFVRIVNLSGVLTKKIVIQ